MRVRTYKSTNKTIVAQAYGYRKSESIVVRIQKCIHRLSDDQVIQLGEWTGHCILLPSQIEIIVFLLGNPAEPELLFSEKVVEE